MNDLLKVAYLSAIAAAKKVVIIATQAWLEVSSPNAIAGYKVVLGIIGLAAVALIAVGNETYKAGEKVSDWCDELVQECLIPDVENHEVAARIQETLWQWAVAHLPEWFKGSVTRNYFKFMRYAIA